MVALFACTRRGFCCFEHTSGRRCSFVHLHIALTGVIPLVTLLIVLLEIMSVILSRIALALYSLSQFTFRTNRGCSACYFARSTVRNNDCSLTHSTIELGPSCSFAVSTSYQRYV